MYRAWEQAILAAFLPLSRLGLGLGPVPGTGTQLMCFIARDDLVWAIEHSMAHQELRGPVNVLTPHPVTNWEFACTPARILHRPRFPWQPYPEGLPLQDVTLARNIQRLCAAWR
jgi:NAD dependent epimerase/dehydratase family enzyme